MAKYNYAIEYRSTNRGEVEADSQEEAEEKARNAVAKDHTHYISSILVWNPEEEGADVIN